MGEDTIDLSKVNKLVQEKYDIERRRVEGQATAFANLKKLLSREQREKMRGTQEIFRGPYGRSGTEEE